MTNTTTTTKTFEQICRLSQTGVKLYMRTFLEDYGYETVCEDGFLYAKGSIPVLLVAHMDTVHKEAPITINKNAKGWISSPQGIGGDDRCGIYMIQEIVKAFNVSVLLCEDEEKGCIGAGKFCKTEYVNNLGVNYMIELDRKGKNDAVFYSCDNAEFTEFILTNTKYKKEWGIYTDISEIMPESGIAGVNFSCGYYSPHTTVEYVKPDEMQATIDMLKKLLAVPVKEPFEYVRNKYGYYGSSGYYRSGKSGSKQQSMLPSGSSYYSEYTSEEEMYSRENAKKAKKDRNQLTMVVYVEDWYNDTDEEIMVTGNTAAECWMNFFMDYPDYCYSMVYNYYYM